MFVYRPLYSSIVCGEKRGPILHLALAVRLKQLSPLPRQGLGEAAVGLLPASLTAKLGSNSSYMAEALCQLVHIVHEISDVDHRLNIIFDLMFDRDLIALCSWTGRGHPDQKICLSKYNFIIRLVQYAGGNHFMT